MTLRLTVQTDAWRRRIAACAADHDQRLIAVVKGNGYGFGRRRLLDIATQLLPPGTPLAVGTAHELAAVTTSASDGDSVFGWSAPERSAGVATTATSADGSPPQPPRPAPIHVLVPARSEGEAAALRAAGAVRPVVAMVGAPADLVPLEGAPVSVAIKLATSMRRFGVAVTDVPALVDAVTRRHPLHGFAAHLPLTGGSGARAAEAAALLDALDAGPAALPRRLSLSHLDATDLAALRRRFPHWELHLRVGTALWHGTKEELHLGTDVFQVAPLAAGDRAGYHGTPAPADGWLVIVGTGSASGVVPLDGGRSPFHHRRHRLAMLEHPHMHSSMLFVPRGDAVPEIGETVDVQRPLTSVTIDELHWA